jgi:hypothetical protein
VQQDDLHPCWPSKDLDLDQLKSPS